MWNFTDFQIWYDLDQVFNKTKSAWAITDIHHHKMWKWYSMQWNSLINL